MELPALQCGAGKFLHMESAMPRARSPARKAIGSGNRMIAAVLLGAAIAVSALLAPSHAAFAADAGVLALTQQAPAQAAASPPVPSFAAPPVTDGIEVAAALNRSQSSRLEARREDALTTKIEQVTMFASQCGLAMPAQGARGSLACPFDDSDLGVKIGTKFGQTQTFANFAFGTTSPWTPQRQLNTYRPGMLEQNSAMLIGVSQGMLDNRLRLTTEMAWSDSRERALFDAPLLARGGRELRGTSRLVRAEATLLDSPRRQFTLKAEYSTVSDGFAMRQAMVLGRGIALPGKRLALSSALKLGSTRFVASLDDYRSFYGTGSSRRLGVSHNGISLSLRSKSFDFQPSSGQFATLSSRSGQTSISLDFDMTSLSPALAAPFKALGPLAPQSLSFNWRSGWSENSYAGIAERFRRTGWDASASWDTPIGETSFDYSLDRRVGVAPLAVTKTNQSYQLTHMVRLGGWRLGADVMLSKDSATGSRGYRERSWSTGQTLAYSRANGPEFRLRIGQDRDRMRYFNNTYASSTNGLSVTATLDLTQFLRKRFERDDLRLKFEFRKRVDSNEDTTALLEDLFERSVARTDRSVFLLSAGMKF